MKILLALLAVQGIAATQTASDPGSFDPGVLTPEGQEAYRSLLSMDVVRNAGGQRLGLCDPEAPLFRLWDEPMGGQAFRALVVEASPAGRFLAVCGLQPLDPEQYRTCCETLADEQEPVMVFSGGCIGTRLPLGEAVQRFAPDATTWLRRNWEATRPARHLEPRPGYERNLSPTGRQALEILRAATYLDGSYWVPVEDAIGPMGALYDLLEEPGAADALLDLLHDASPEARLYGAGGLALACPVAIHKVVQFLGSDEESVRMEIEGSIEVLPVAAAAEWLLTRDRTWIGGVDQRRSEHARAQEPEHRSAPFDRDRLTPGQAEAYDALAGAEVVQVGRWQELAPSTRALLTLWDADDAAGALELLSATATPAGRLLAVCGLHALDPVRARRCELALRRSGSTVRALAADGTGDVAMEVALGALVSDGELPGRLRSEWKATHGGGQDDPPRELTLDGFRYLPALPPSAYIASPFGLERCGFGVRLAHARGQLLVGASAFIDPGLKGAVFVLTPHERWRMPHESECKPEQTILPFTRTDGFGDRIAASDSTVAVLRRAGVDRHGDQTHGAVEVYEPSGDDWTPSSECGIENGSDPGLAVSRDTVAVAGREGAYVFERGPLGWERRELELPEGAAFRSTGVVAADRKRIALGLAGGVAVFERTEEGWTSAAQLTRGEDGPLGRVASLALQGDHLLAGTLEGSRLPGEGSVVAFDRRDGRWIPAQTLRGSDSLPGDGFGDCLALDGERLVVLGRRGPARLFELEDGLWRERANLVAGFGTASEPVAYDAFGTGVCDLYGDCLVIGMPSWEKGDGRLAVFDVAAALERARQ